MPAARRIPLVASVVAATLLLAGCGSSSGNDSLSSSGASTTTAAPGSVAGSGGSKTPKVPTTPANAKGCRTAAEATAQSKAPAVKAPTKAETSMTITDTIPGCGALVTSNSTVKVQYILKSKSSGQVVDSSWSRNQPFDVTLGQGQVISGWDIGIPGMRAGGERTLVLGPDYGYGPSGSGAQIAPNDTLVFVIDALSVT